MRFHLFGLLLRLLSWTRRLSAVLKKPNSRATFQGPPTTKIGGTLQITCDPGNIEAHASLVNISCPRNLLDNLDNISPWDSQDELVIA